MNDQLIEPSVPVEDPASADRASLGVPAAMDDARGLAATLALPRQLSARVIGLDQSEIIACDFEALSEEEACFKAPANCGFSVGERYEVVFGGDEATEEWVRRIGDCHYATVLQTKPCRNHPEQAMDVSIRFDQPLMF